MQTEEILKALTVSIRNGGQTLPPVERTCLTCNGDGWIVRDLTGHGRKAFRCDCQISSRIARAIPLLYQNARLTDCKQATVDRVMEFFNNPDSLGLLVSGPTGVGKTHLAAGIARALIEARHEVRFLEVSRFYSEIRECMRLAQSEECLIAPYASVYWLVLDDFGSGARSDFERRYALDLLNRRANARLRTIVTTNCELQELAEKFDERIASRLSGFDQIGASGRDRRAQRGKTDEQSTDVSLVLSAVRDLGRGEDSY